ncbi:hypothetical protein [Kaistella antarctica]|uniref:TonB C-terminal domain-containing protein n=1 Tax=Kaistella antarctica TaxID=266748 RepID=A0A448NNX0_9FLAO|nr:hypothetical protein [Kaistella antarctica]KEY19646.1 hypothetical protein HY04_14760 [Kaistella antarctica]SEW09428.1 hypothetical protein SAMN05421765_2396 [Kaistella antarctica]VEH96875.1 Uncharacterised protein [Kaistella antarctica]
MKKTLLLVLVLTLNILAAQKIKSGQKATTAQKFEKIQSQDLSVPPPPITLFPAQFPEGNKGFIKRIGENLGRKILNTSSKNLKTQIILKIDPSGNVLNISTYGPNENFNEEVKKSVKIVTEDIKWEPAKNKEGSKVTDIVRLPFTLKIVE